MRKSRPCVLVATSYYEPGFRAGGPIRSLVNLVEALGNEFEFRIITSDRDLGESSAYAGICTDRWIPHKRAQVMYLRPGLNFLARLRAVTLDVQFDTLYLNSIFARSFSILPLWLRSFGIIPRRRVVCAPRGELEAAALERRAIRKKAYLGLIKSAGLIHDTIWHATSESEQNGIQRVFGSNAIIEYIPPVVTLPSAFIDPPKKRVGELLVVYIARIHPHKNLRSALSALSKVHGKVIFSIYGPIEDMAYWRECCLEIASLPKGIEATYRGVLEHNDVRTAIGANHVLLQPTKSENFGHTIFEALAAARPVIIGNATPWKALEAQHAGWDVPPFDVAALTQAVQICVDIDSSEYGSLMEGARAYACKIADRDILPRYRRLFDPTMSTRSVKTRPTPDQITGTRM